MSEKYNNEDSHKKAIILLNTIDECCRKYGVKYALHGGTLLGAERNGKLIPWDDDVDISMLRSEIDTIEKISHEEDIPFFIERGEAAPWLTGFSMINPDGSKTTIDVFIWDYISESKLKQALKINILRLIQGMLKINIDYSTYTKSQALFVFLSHILGIPLTRNAKTRLYDWVSKRFLVGKKRFIHRSNDAYVGVSYVFDTEYMEEYGTIVLEGREYMVAKRYKEFLIRNYGENYLIPPKEAERQIVHDHNKGFLPESERGGLFSVRR